ncbi:PP2C family protein-serine/threonine phosphatase [Vibrio splendidus]|jgi:PPM family protein phosphatase|uniref:PP2C family protein-serine/threonine phosphatase n=1 Tax=Vibrio splendidus TaxID=29497 RepID=UPI002235CDA3|nr:protein phosphatase 2C domain-containing protein [Vibrio splendidus]MCW4442257.1 protein phosphatase 2C domain-containing protein [Vibrio splendidus]
MYHEIEVGSFSYSKPDKDVNEDCLLLPTYTYNSDIVFAIADGVGSLSGASQASQCAINSISKLVNQPEFTVENALKKAKDSINELAKNNEQLSHSATTLTLVQVGKHTVTIGHIGDCRAYVKKEARFVQLTNDHTRYQEVIDSGEYTPRMLRSHKERLSSVITKALSFQTELDYDLVNIPIEECIDGSSILMSLMSDGAYDHWHKRAKFADSTMNTPSAFVNSLRKRIEKQPTDDYSCLNVKLILSKAL